MRLHSLGKIGWALRAAACAGLRSVGKLPGLCLCIVQAPSVFGNSAIPTIFLPEAQETQLALEAAPEHLRKAATVYVFGTDGYRKAKAGTNGFTCLVNRDGNQN